MCNTKNKYIFRSYCVLHREQWIKLLRAKPIAFVNWPKLNIGVLMPLIMEPHLGFELRKNNLLLGMACGFLIVGCLANSSAWLN